MFGLNKKDYEWQEFIYHILYYDDSDPDWTQAQERVGSHWEPYWRACSVCTHLFRPTFILKLETLEEDLASYVVELGMTQAHLDIPRLTENKNGRTEEAQVALYYSQLTKEEVWGLYEVYKMDHDLFGYSPDKYVEYARLD